MGRNYSRGSQQRRTKGPRVNHDIKYDEIRVIDPDGEQVGVMSSKEGQMKANEFDLDLVEVAPEARPPVCRIMDYGKYKYEQSKKENAKSDNVSLKTVKMRPKTGEHDLETILGRAMKFLNKGNQVRFVMQMRGRERKYSQRWADQLHEIIKQMGEDMDRDIKIVSVPEPQGWQITSIVEPA